MHSLRKIPTRLGSTNFCTYRPILHRVLRANQMVPNAPKLVRNTPEHEIRVQWGGSRAFIAINSNATSWHELFHQFYPFCTEYWKATKQSQMHPNSTKCTKSRLLSPMGWIGCVHCEKFRRDFVARHFAPVRSVLHRVS